MMKEEEELDFGEEEIDDYQRRQSTQQYYTSRNTYEDDGEDAISIGERSPSPSSRRRHENDYYNNSSRNPAHSSDRPMDQRDQSDTTLNRNSNGERRPQYQEQQQQQQSRPNQNNTSYTSASSSSIATPVAPAVDTPAPLVGGSFYAPDGSRLPPGWITKVSTSSGTLYYRNDELNKSSWDLPVASEGPNVERKLSNATSSQSTVHPSRIALVPRGSNPG